MATPIFILCNTLPAKNAISSVELQAIKRRNNIVGGATLAFDVAAFPTLLVIGILGALSLITLPTAASYAMIGTAAAGALTWVAFMIIWFTAMVSIRSSCCQVQME